MRVRVWVEQEVETDVSLIDMMAELKSMDEPLRLDLALQGISAWYSFTTRIPDEVIEQMNDKQLSTIADAIEPQAARFRQVLTRRQATPVEQKAT